MALGYNMSLPIHKPISSLKVTILQQSRANPAVHGNWSKVLSLGEVWDLRGQTGYIVRNGEDAIVLVMDSAGVVRAYKNFAELDFGEPRLFEAVITAVPRQNVNTGNNYAVVTAVASDDSILDKLNSLDDQVLNSPDQQLETLEAYSTSIWSRTPGNIRFTAFKRYFYLNVFIPSNAVNPLVRAVLKVYV